MSGFQLSASEEQWVEATLKTLTLKQKAGQVFCPYMMPDEYTPEQQIQEYAKRVHGEIETYTPGGYYLNRYYLPTTPMLLNRLQDESPVPLLIAADMEAGAGGGLGGVIAPELTVFPPAMGLGAAGSERYACLAGQYTALQAKAIGVNFVFAPSLDVNNNPENPIINIRSFGEDPEQVSSLGSAFIQGLQNEGVAASAKHFPGHGDTSDDSHLLLSAVQADRKRLDEVELYPYRRAIHEAGVYTIMTTHLAVPALDPDSNIPATFSSRILKDLLRDEMGFDGLIVTDAMLMKAITSQCDAGEAAVRAFEAGADIILMPPDLDIAFRGLMDAAENGRIGEDRLEESVRRILSLKAKIGLHQNALTHSDEEAIHQIHCRASSISFNISADAVTLVKNEGTLLPLREEENLTTVVLSDERGDFYDGGAELLDDINLRSPAASFVSIQPGADENLFAQARQNIQQADTVLFAVIVQVIPEKGTVELPDAYLKLIQEAIDEKKRTAMVSFGNPYLIRRFPQLDAYLCAYGYFSEMTVAVSELLYGERLPHGKLPVQIPGVCDIGTGLSF